MDQDAPAEELEKAFQPNTKAVFAETISNPAGVVLDIDKFVKLAHEHGVPMICDNTFATPINCRPFEFGVDIVTHSTTKYMDGHAMALGGAIVDSGMRMQTNFRVLPYRTSRIMVLFTPRNSAKKHTSQKQPHS